MEKKKFIKLRATGHYPCPWDDLIDDNNKVYVSVYTLISARKDPSLKLEKSGITFNEQDKVYDIVINVPKLTEEIVKEALERLSKITNIEYQFGKAKKRYISLDI